MFDVLQTDTDGVVLKYYLYRAVDGPGFIYPVWVLYLLAHGVTYTEIGLIGAVQSVVIVAGEIPTGYVGDRVGRRDSLVLGQLLYAVSTAGLLLGETFPVFLGAFAAMSLGRTFISGSGSAWLYDLLEERLDESRYAAVKGRGSAIGGWVTALTMVLGGGLYVAGAALPFAALLVMRLVTIATALGLPRTGRYGPGADPGPDRDGPAAGDEPGTEADAGSDAEPEQLGPREVLPLLRDRLTDPALRTFVAYLTVFVGVALAVDPYIQPIALKALRTDLGGRLAALGVPEPVLLGLLYASFTGVAAVASDRAEPAAARFGRRGVLVGVPLLLGVTLLLPLVAPVLAVPMFFGVKGANSLVRPVAEAYLNDRVDSVGRATLLSGVAMVYGLGRVPLSVGAGGVADWLSPLAAVAALGLVLLLVGGGLVVLRTPLADAEATGSSPAD